MLVKKRFLLDDSFDIKKLNFVDKKYKVIEFYTHISRCKEISYHSIDDNIFIKYIKTKQDKKEQLISKKKFYKKLKERISFTIKKNIFDLKDGSKIISYKKNFKNIVFLDTTSEHINEELLPYIKDDVTDKKRYQDKFFALYENPLKDDKNIHNIFRKLKNMEIKNMNNIIKKDMSVESAVRIKLYELYLKLVQDRFRLLKDDQNSANRLSMYRKRLSILLDILIRYKDYFDEELVLKVIENLKYIYQKTFINEELDSIKKYLLLYKECMDRECFINFLKDEDKYITKEVDGFSYFMQTREYSIILKQLELLIKESSVEDDELKSSLTIKNALKKSIKKVYKRLNKSIKKYLDCEDIDSFNKILKRAKLLYNLNNEFSFLFENKIFYKRKRVLVKVIEALEENIKIFRNIELSKTKVKDASSLDCLMKKFEKEKKKSLNKLKKAIKHIKNSKKLFIS